jgi:hypothetical protein
MADQFLIALEVTGSNPAGWSVLSTLLASGTGAGDITLRSLEWAFEPYSKYDKLANGQDKGRGFPVARWTFKGLRIEQRENLRDFCSGPSANVYIRTPTNETSAGVRTWDDFLGIVHWVQRAELASDGLNMVEMVELTFTHLVAI